MRRPFQWPALDRFTRRLRLAGDWAVIVVKVLVTIPPFAVLLALAILTSWLVVTFIVSPVWSVLFD